MVLISDPFNIWLVRFPLPAFGLVLIAGLCSILITRGIRSTEMDVKMGYRKRK